MPSARLQTLMRRSRSAWAALAVLACLAGGPATVHAQVIDVDGPELEKGEREIKSLNTVNGRYRTNADGSPRSSHELNMGYTPLDYFKVSAHLDFENIAAEDFRLDHGTVKTFLELVKTPEKGGLGLGWHTGIQAALHKDATNSVVFGPIVKLAHGQAAILLNPYFEKTFGQNHEPGIALTYGWQARWTLREGFALGVEGVGKVEDLGNSPPASEQDHRVGPAVFLEWPAGDKRAIMLDIGVLAGLTEATPTASLKLNLGTKF